MSPATGGKIVAQQEVAVAVHDRQTNAAVAQAAECVDNFAVKIIVRIVDAIVARPSLKQITEDKNLLGFASLMAKIMKKTPGDPRRFR